MYVRGQKFGYFGHWLSDLNTVEMKNFGTHLVFICQKFQRNPKMLTFDFSGPQIYLWPGKIPFATVRNMFGSLHE